MMKILVIAIALPALLQACQQADTDTICGPTVRNLPTEFINSCNSIPGLGSAKCQTAYNDFSKAFSGKDPKTVKRSDYNDYYKLIPVDPPRNQNLFWSGTFHIVTELSKNIYGAIIASSPNMPTSKIINQIGEKIKEIPYWCGKLGAGIDYDTKNCDCTPYNTFWIEFSVRFAKAATGNAFFLGNGERPDGQGAYFPTSVFAVHEVPNINPAAVKQMIVMVVHRAGKGESCEKPRTDSLVKLKSDLERKGIAYKCYNVIGDPNDRKADRYNAQNAADIIRPYQTGQTFMELQDYFNYNLRNGIANY